MKGKIQHYYQNNTVFVELDYQEHYQKKSSLLLFNKDGKIVWKKKLTGEKRHPKFQFNANQLKNGTYHFWLDVNGKMQVETIMINHPEKRQSKNYLKLAVANLLL